MAEASRVRRLRPALGSFVRVSVHGDPARSAAAIDAAYAAIESVERAMSFHRADSALHTLHRAPPGTAQPTDPALWRVLWLCQDLWRHSDGLFDPTLAPRWVAAGLLPRPAQVGEPDAGADFGDVELLAGHRVRLRRRVWMDLGGIAKGYAVDAALVALRAHGVVAASVNAGGDLACFGAPQTVALRDPRAPARLASRLVLDEAALATSADYFRPGALRGRDGVRPRLRRGSVSVVAPSCVLADGLTKVVWAAPRRAPAILRRFDARALCLDAQARPRWLN